MAYPSDEIAEGPRNEDCHDRALPDCPPQRPSHRACASFPRSASRVRASFFFRPLELARLPPISRRRFACRLLDIGVLEELAHALSILAGRAVIAFALDGIRSASVRGRSVWVLSPFHVCALSLLISGSASGVCESACPAGRGLSRPAERAWARLPHRRVSHRRSADRDSGHPPIRVDAGEL
jgi:hypothetical protein